MKALRFHPEAETETFPFGILFPAGREQIAVLAVMHLHREPGYWKPRALGSFAD